MVRQIAFFIFLLATVGYSQISRDPITQPGPGRSAFSGGLVLSEIEYEIDDVNVDIERKTLQAEYAHSFAAGVSGFGFFGFIFDSEIQSRGSDTEDGKGFVFGGGIRGIIHQIQQWRFHWLSSFLYLDESYDDDSVEVELDLVEIDLIGTVEFMVQRSFSLYGAIQLVPYSDGDVDTKVGNVNFDDDIERDGLLNLKIGARLDFGQAFFRPELTFVNEKTLAFVGGLSF